MEDKDYEIRQLVVDENSPLFDRKGMFYKEFPSDLRQVRYFTLLIVQKAPPEIREVNLLEQQISELIINAIKHGNKGDINKKVKIWYRFTPELAHLIVEDEGEGFKNLEKWNEFHKIRTEAFLRQDFDTLEKYISFRTEESDEMDGGNALFAAIEYWNGGMVYNDKRNAVAVLKTFPKRHRGITIEEIQKMASI